MSDIIIPASVLVVRLIHIFNRFYEYIRLIWYNAI